MKLNERMLRGKEIYNQLGQIKKLWNDVWYVKSQSGHGTYTVTETQEGWKCQCYQIYHNYIRPHESLDGKNTIGSCGVQGGRQQQMDNADSKR